MKRITSKANRLVKFFVQLRDKGQFRRKERLFAVEGRREVRLALEGGYRLTEIFFCPELTDNDILEKVQGLSGDAEFIEISKEVYEKMAYRGSTEGILAIGRWKNHSLEALLLPDNPLILVAENIEKPGNIGAMLRTSDAANLDAFILANPVTDLYNPNIIRSSVGGVFTVNVAVGSSKEVVDFLRSRKIDFYSATLQDSSVFYDVDFTKPSAVVVGSEANGLTQIFRQYSKKNILIPMQGKLDSLNVSVSAAILIFEAKRQRRQIFS